MSEFFQDFIITWAIYFVAWSIFASFEYTFPANKKQKTFSKHLRTDLYSGVVNATIMAVVISSIEPLFLNKVLYPYMPYQISTGIEQWPILAQFLFALLLLDTSQYIRHRITHSFFWPFHATHHSALELRSTVHLRMHPVDYFLSTFMQTMFMYVFGFGGPAILLALMVSPLYNMWLHVNLDISYPKPLNFLFASPNYHKWHHAKASKAIDKNFADMFPFLDYIGGTYYYPENQKPKHFGVYGVSDTNPLHNTYLGNLLYPLNAKKRSKK